MNEQLYFIVNILVVRIQNNVQIHHHQKKKLTDIIEHIKMKFGMLLICLKIRLLLEVVLVEKREIG